MINCERCFYNTICYLRYSNVTNEENGRCINFKDRSKVFDLPCRVGDKVYFAKKGESKVIKGDVMRISLDYENSPVFSIRKQSGKRFVTRDYHLNSFDSSIFLDEAKAEKILEEKNKSLQ